MVEVFKTNVRYQEEAEEIIGQIRRSCQGYDANFDLQDCDNILRVCCTGEVVQSEVVINLLKKCGFTAEILEEDIQSSVVLS